MSDNRRHTEEMEGKGGIQDIIVEIRILINFDRNFYLPHKILSTTSYVFSSTFEW